MANKLSTEKHGASGGDARSISSARNGLHPALGMAIVVGCPSSAISLFIKQPVAEKMNNVNPMFYFHYSLHIRAG